MLTGRLQCFVIGIHMSVDAVSHVLVLRRSENFVGSCLVSHLLEASREHFWFEAIDIFVLEGAQNVCVIGVSGGYLEVIVVDSEIAGESGEELIVFGGHGIINYYCEWGVISTQR